MFHLWLFVLFDRDYLRIVSALEHHCSMSFRLSRAAASTSESDDLTEISINPLHLSQYRVQNNLTSVVHYLQNNYA